MKNRDARLSRLDDLLRTRILVLDGAMGTMIQSHGFEENDFRGVRFQDHAQDLKGNNDLLLLTQPEAIEATAPVPDDPPVMFRWRRVVHRIIRADGPERIGPEWWRAPERADGTHLRDYYRVEDTSGRRFWLYREGLYRADAAPAWFVHGIFE